MIAIQLLQVKDFMNKLLRTDLFDHFLLSEATIRGKGSYEIDGHLVPDFYSPCLLYTSPSPRDTR